MNDFLIQVFETEKMIRSFDFYGIDSSDFLNYKEDVFKVKVLSNSRRKEFLSEVIRNEKVKNSLSYFEEMFDQIWLKLFGVNAPKPQKMRFIHELVNGEPNNALKFSKKQVYDFTMDYLVKLFNVKN